LYKSVSSFLLQIIVKLLLNNDGSILQYERSEFAYYVLEIKPYHTNVICTFSLIFEHTLPTYHTFDLKLV